MKVQQRGLGEREEGGVGLARRGRGGVVARGDLRAVCGARHRAECPGMVSVEDEDGDDHNVQVKLRERV